MSYSHKTELKRIAEALEKRNLLIERACVGNPEKSRVTRPLPGRLFARPESNGPDPWAEAKVIHRSGENIRRCRIEARLRDIESAKYKGPIVRRTVLTQDRYGEYDLRLLSSGEKPPVGAIRGGLYSVEQLVRELNSGEFRP